MGGGIKHYIFTKFGIGIRDELWLMYRLEIFVSTVFPSLANQKNKDFEWVIFVDKMLPVIFMERLLSEIEVSGLNARLVQVDDYSLVNREIDSILKEVFCDVLLTSRIDDDDCIHVDAIDLIQSRALVEGAIDDVLVISLENGIEFLPSDNCYREVSYDTLAIALTLVEKGLGPKSKSITQYAHHLVVQTLGRQGVKSLHVSIKGDGPLFVYTKHPLSDSYFFGARARIINDPAKIVGFDGAFFRGFGLTENNLRHLVSIMKQAPVGMPHKYLEKLGDLRNMIKKEVEQGAGEQLDLLLLKKSKYERRAVRPNPVRGGGQKVRLAILGSCVTRDLFEFQPDLLNEFEVCFYMARSSVVSYMGLPCVDPRLKISGDGFEDKRSRMDLEKSHWSQLEMARPDIVIVDFIDERIGLMQHAGSVFSASGPVIKAFERAGISCEIKRPWSVEAKRLREWAVPAFFDRLSSICQNIFVHKAVWAESFRGRDGGIESFSGSEFERLIELNNGILNGMIDVLDGLPTAVEQIGGLEAGLMAGGDHRWAFCPYHYNGSYYKTLARQLRARVMC